MLRLTETDWSIEAWEHSDVLFCMTEFTGKSPFMDAGMVSVRCTFTMNSLHQVRLQMQSPQDLSLCINVSKIFWFNHINNGCYFDENIVVICHERRFLWFCVFCRPQSCIVLWNPPATTFQFLPRTYRVPLNSLFLFSLWQCGFILDIQCFAMQKKITKNPPLRVF